MKTYFDRNVFDFLKKNNSSTEFNIVKEYCENGKLEILLSTTVLEETYFCKEAKLELEFVVSLTGKEKMIKPVPEMLRNIVESYASEQDIPDLFMPLPEEILNYLEKGVSTEELDNYFNELKSFKEEFEEKLQIAFETAKESIEKVGTPDNFNELWGKSSPTIIQLLTEKYGVFEKCKKQCIEVLFEIKPIKLYTIYYVSLIHSKWFGEQKNPGKVEASERGDWFHSIQSGVADVFVTNEGRLLRWLNRIEMKDFEILNLKDFIEKLKNMT